MSYNFLASPNVTKFSLICSGLEEMGITYVVVFVNGGGDSGGIENYGFSTNADPSFYPECCEDCEITDVLEYFDRWALSRLGAPTPRLFGSFDFASVVEDFVAAAFDFNGPGTTGNLILNVRERRLQALCSFEQYDDYIGDGEDEDEDEDGDEDDGSHWEEDEMTWDIPQVAALGAIVEQDDEDD